MKKGYEPGSKKAPGKMKTRFLMQCILPAIIVLGIVCGVSIYFSRVMACQNMKSAMTGQQTSKMNVLSGNCEAVFDESKLNSYNERILSILENGGTPEPLYGIINDMSSNATFAKAQIAVYDMNIVVGIKGYRAEFTGNEVWYDAEKLSRNEKYLAETGNPDDKESSLFTFVYPVVNHSGKNVGALVFGTNDSAFLPIIQMTTNMKEQTWFILDPEDRLCYLSNGTGMDLSGLIEKAAAYDNRSDFVPYKGTQFIMRVSPMSYFDNFKLVYTIPIEPIVEQSYQTMVLSIIVCIISILLIVIFVMTFSGKIVNEINDVRRSVKGISENDFSEAIESKTNDEMGMLVTEFNGVIDKLKYQAEHDGKTSYYNSETFARKSVEYIKMSHDRSYAIIRVDIDNFSFINDIFDWEVGDSILVGIARELENVFGEDAVYGYLGNDIFVICTGYVFREAVIQKIERASEKIKECAEKYMPITPHFGICETAEADMDISILCDYAGIALKTVKGNLLETYAVYDEKFDENHKVQKFVESNKIAALENRDFYILLQPKCDIMTGEVVGAEALVRWRDHTSGEIISPGKFIPIFEKNGFVITLDRFVWEETCKVIQKWRKLGYRDIPVSVNVSRMHIIHDTFVEDFAALVRKYDIPPHLVEVEITESALLENSEDALQEVMLGLKNHGFKLLMDDFASGYSSLIALQRLPFDVIKIDKGLIDKIGEGFNRDFVAGIISFLKEIKKDIVIEGVEYDWQKEILRNTGGRVIQGFCFSRPIAVNDFELLAFGEVVEDKDQENIQ